MNENTSKLEKISQNNINIFIDPSYPVFNEDALFDLSDPLLNRDDQLLPFHRLRQHLITLGKQVHTADFLMKGQFNKSSKYYSLGILKNYHNIEKNGLAKLEAFVIMEPPVVVPELYAALPDLTRAFKRVYVHNIDGHGYSLNGVHQKKLHRLNWPIPYNDILDKFWSERNRKKRIVVINGNHKPRSRKNEQYSTRISAMTELAKLEAVDLYGRGWEKWWSRDALWIPYWRNRKVIMSIYKGPCNSKFEVLREYDFCLCFENMSMNGYITEKLFDCLYAGTIPLYLGAPDILKYIPARAFIDCRKYSSWSDLWAAVREMSDEEICSIREAGRDFVRSEKANPFFDSIKNIIEL